MRTNFTLRLNYEEYKQIEEKAMEMKLTKAEYIRKKLFEKKEGKDNE